MEHGKILVIIPTYNERENIPKVLDIVFGLNIPELDVLIIDDNSPDGTAEVVKEYQQQNPRVNLLPACRWRIPPGDSNVFAERCWKPSHWTKFIPTVMRSRLSWILKRGSVGFGLRKFPLFFTTGRPENPKCPRPLFLKRPFWCGSCAFWACSGNTERAGRGFKLPFCLL